jgi:hypothetical protein
MSTPSSDTLPKTDSLKPNEIRYNAKRDIYETLIRCNNCRNSGILGQERTFSPEYYDYRYSPCNTCNATGHLVVEVPRR